MIANEIGWTAWNVTPEITLGTLLLAGIYGRGVRIRTFKTDRLRSWRHLSFYAGLGVVFLTLQSPINTIAEHSFVGHQIQHLLLRMLGPMLIMLSFPQGVLVAGTPDWLQRLVVRPVITNRVMSGLFAYLAHPAAATFLFIGTLYFWQFPIYHNGALLNEDLHYVMHTSLLFVGLLFFWRIFDHRPPPVGPRYGVRLMMLWLLLLSNILLGSYTALKQRVLYPAYDVLGRLGIFSALTDEQIGGIVIWIPSSMMGLVALLIVIHLWGRQETAETRRRDEMIARQGYGRNEPALTGAEVIARAAPKNRSMALGFATFVACVYTAAILVGVINLMMIKV